MKIREILQPVNTSNNVKADTKKSLLEFTSKLLAHNLPAFEYDQIFNCLVQREKIGSTSIGHGVAIPHCRIDDIEKPIGALIRLQKPIDFAAIDNSEVDLFFALLIPEKTADEYLEVLAALAKKFGNKEFREKLRTAQDDDELYRFATGI